MRGKTFVTILGLLLFQALAAIYMSITTTKAFELVVAVLFLAVATSMVAGGRRAPIGMGVLFIFALGFINVVYLSFSAITLWLVIMLCLDAAGFILTLEQLTPAPVKRRRHEAATPLVARRDLIDKELPGAEPAQVVVYHDEARERAVEAEVAALQQAGKLVENETASLKKKTASRKVAKKKATRKAAKKKAKR